MNATKTKIRKIESLNRFGSVVEKFQVLYFTNCWHEDPNISLDREQAKRRAKELSR